MIEGNQQHFLVPQSKAASRIQHDTSGPFDMLHGTELIAAIEGFFHTQQRYSQDRLANTKQPLLLIGMSDMRDDTAARFAAGKFRRLFRSLRPILDEERLLTQDQHNSKDIEYSRPRLILTKAQLDDRGQLFAQMLIEEWLNNPSGVRLLRIALDIYPEANILEKVLIYLRDCWQVGGCKSYQKEVKQYCLAEIFRAGATETGMVPDKDCLPKGVDLNAYQCKLGTEAESITAAFFEVTSKKRFSWYLMQQVFLFLSSQNRVSGVKLPKRKRQQMLSRYIEFIGFLQGEKQINVERRCIYTILAATAFNNEAILENQQLNNEFIEKIAFTAPSVAVKYWNLKKLNALQSHFATAKRIGLEIIPKNSADVALPVLASISPNPFWEEENLIKLAAKVADYLEGNKMYTPWQIVCKCKGDQSIRDIFVDAIADIKINNTPNVTSELFFDPDWAENNDEIKRYKLGQILRFALRGSIDFYQGVQILRRPKQYRYSIPISHWLLSRYGGFHGRTSFAPEWIPISSWVEKLLFELMRWPGCGNRKPVFSFENIKQMIFERKDAIKNLRGKASKMLFLEQEAAPPYEVNIENWRRPIRIGIVQNVIPDLQDFSNNNPLLHEPEIRHAHRRHLAAIIEGIEQMLQVRNTHINRNNSDNWQLDMLVFPELSVHSADLDTLLIPFVRRHRCIILAGLVYHNENILPGAPIINSGIWLIPTWDRISGMQVRRIKQGKHHLTDAELRLNPTPQSFRPAQWIINYVWSNSKRPLKLTASICYDSTDLNLASDLRDRSDIFIVSALNKDVGTFDRMAESLHYHMFQGIIVANNGQFGGSNFYMPFSDTYNRQILHLHGQPQAQIAFIEIDPEKFICKGKRDVCSSCQLNQNQEENRNVICNMKPIGNWKTPPAGWS